MTNKEWVLMQIIAENDDIINHFSQGFSCRNCKYWETDECKNNEDQCVVGCREWLHEEYTGWDNDKRLC